MGKRIAQSLRGVLLAGAMGIAGTCILAIPGNSATQDPATELAGAICAAPDAQAIAEALRTVGPSDTLSDFDIAEAFGNASFMSDLGRCANKKAIHEAFAAFKQGKKDEAKLDAAFAGGRVAGKPNGGTASVASYQASYESLGAAGDPPSGH